MPIEARTSSEGWLSSATCVHAPLTEAGVFTCGGGWIRWVFAWYKTTFRGFLSVARVEHNKCNREGGMDISLLLTSRVGQGCEAMKVEGSCIVGGLR